MALHQHRSCGTARQSNLELPLLVGGQVDLAVNDPCWQRNDRNLDGSHSDFGDKGLVMCRQRREFQGMGARNHKVVEGLRLAH